jgi:hypothetical protein
MNKTSKIKKIIKLGFFLDQLILMYIFCLKHQKNRTIENINNIYQQFYKELDEQAKSEFYKQVQQIMENKTEKFISDLKNNLSDSELREISKELNNFNCFSS